MHVMGHGKHIVEPLGAEEGPVAEEGARQSVGLWMVAEGIKNW